MAHRVAEDDDSPAVELRRSEELLATVRPAAVLGGVSDTERRGDERTHAGPLGASAAKGHHWRLEEASLKADQLLVHLEAKVVHELCTESASHEDETEGVHLVVAILECLCVEALGPHLAEREALRTSTAR